MKPLRAPDRTRRNRTAALTLLGLAAALLSGCTSLGTGEPAPVPRPAPARPAEVLPVDPQSDSLRAYYAGIEADRVARRMMRRDDGAGEVVITAARLAETYSDIALHDEHPGSGRPVGAASVLRRWEGPVRYSLEFGPSVGRAQRVADYDRVRRLVNVLATESDHDIALTPLGQTDGNFHVLVLSETERQEAGDRLRALIPGIDEGAVRLITDLSRETFCIALAFSRDGSARYTEAVAVIRAEHPDLTREACYHEELAQGLGLVSDSGRARPSIFNDNQEFAFLTVLDKLMLRLHFDPRLHAGMTEREARPIIFSIASELTAGAS